MTEENKDEFDTLLQRAAELRGHLCVGLPLGLKMARMGLKLLNMTEDEKSEKLVVFVENDKCPADAIQIATGCSAGSRRLRIMLYGKSAATFIDRTTGKGYRVLSKKDLMARALELGIKDKLVKPGEKVEELSKLERQILMNAFMKMAPEELLDFQEVKIPLTSPLLPSKMGPREYCAQCGEEIMDGKGIAHGKRTLCKPCVDGYYYERL